MFGNVLIIFDVVPEGACQEGEGETVKEPIIVFVV